MKKSKHKTQEANLPPPEVSESEFPKIKLYSEYRVFLVISLIFIAAAFMFDKPFDILTGLGRIFLSRGLLLTDYMVVGGIGASIISSTLVGLYSVLLLYLSRAKPTGTTIMALWMAVGWSYWGVNVLSVLPLTCGVWLYCRFKKRPFSDFVVVAILAETIAPIVSLFYFSNPIMLQMGMSWHISLNIVFGAFMGIFCGFFLPAISLALTRMHGGFTLYNLGVTGGVIAMFAAALFRAFGVDVATESMWFTESKFEIAIFLYCLFTALILTGVFLGISKKSNHFTNMKNILSHSGHAPNDFYQLCGESAYINMGLLGLIGTSVTLALGADLNGATFACIFSMVAFGSLGKHIYNVLPLMLGAIICALLNKFDLSSPENILPILFSTCLAPIAGKYGWFWGMAAGFLHVVIVIHIGPVTNGMNLYNNGFASGFVALLMISVITAFEKEEAA